MNSLELLRNVLQKPWDSGVPPLKSKENASGSPDQINLIHLESIALLAKKTFKKSPQDSQIIVVQVINKCWNYALNSPDYSVAFRAARICMRSLPPKAANPQDLTYFQPFEITVEETKIPLPGYLRTLLCRQSLFFKPLFKEDCDGFKERKTGIITMHDVDPVLFTTLIDIITLKSSESKEYSITELSGLLVLANFCDIIPMAQPLIKAVRIKLEELETTIVLDQDEFSSLCNIYTSIDPNEPLLKEVKEKVEDLLKTSIDLNTSFASLLNFTEEFGKDLPFLIVNDSRFDQSDPSYEFLDDAHVKQLIEQCPQLDWLVLHCNQITDATLKAVALAYPKLSKLVIDDCAQVTDKGLAHLARCTALTSLSLEKCVKVTNAGLIHLQPLASLAYLNLSGCSWVDDATLPILGVFQKLRTLNLCGCYQITDAGMKHLRALTLLSNLYLARCSSLTDAGLVQLQLLPKLAKLDISDCMEITEGTCETLETLVALKDVHISLSYKTDTEEQESDLNALEPLLKKGVLIDGNDGDYYQQMIENRWENREALEEPDYRDDDDGDERVEDDMSDS